MTLRLENPNGQAIRSSGDWLPLAHPPDAAGEWKDFHSAKELARAYFRIGSPSVPEEMAALLNSRPETQEYQIGAAVAGKSIIADTHWAKKRYSDLLLSFLMLVAATIAPSIVNADQSGRIEYPKTRRVDHVDTYFGVKAPDPYRWLENDVRQAKDVADWVAAENKVTARYLESIPERENIRRRLTELWNFPQYAGAFKAGGRY